MRVIAGVNGTEQSCESLNFVARMLSAQRDSFVLYFAPEHITLEHADRMLPEIPEELKNALVNKVFSLAREALPDAFRESTTTVVGEKKASEGLLLAADQQKVDLIVVGADERGRSPLYLGRVAKMVARSAEVPVLVYRKTEHECSEQLRVLVAHDGSEAATSAAQQLSRFTWPSGSQGYVVRVVEWLDLSYESTLQGAGSVWRAELSKQTQQLVDTTKQRLADVQRTLIPIFQQNDPEVIDGAKIPSLVKFAREKQIDVIVVGSRYLNAVQRLLGSTTESLLHYAPCSVLVVHSQEKP